MAENNNLDTLRILYLVKGILTAFAGLIMIAYFSFFGLIFSFAGKSDPDFEGFPSELKSIIFIVLMIVLIISIAFAVVQFLASKYLKEKRNYTFILVVAALNCMSGFLGIFLGVFTLVELTKSEVKELFAAS